MKFTFPPESKPLAGYTIKRAIHKGGFGEVYYALSDAGKEVALKLLHENTDVELRGVSQCLNLKHPNLVNIIDIRRDNDQDYWIIMEYVAGKTLDETLQLYTAGMPLPLVQHWVNGLSAGLGFLHDKGIVHRDLKPANVFDEAGIIKIGDVGLAKFISDSRRNAQTESVGTVYYMAPEVARGHYGHEVDVYSLGVVTYEMLTGRVPFEGESTAEILMKHLSQKPDLSPLPEKLRGLIARCLEKDPLKRTPSAMQFREEFVAAMQGRSAAIEIPESAFEDRRDTPPPLRAETPVKPPPLPTIVPNAHADRYARKYQKYEKKAQKWAERGQRYAQKYAGGGEVPATLQEDRPQESGDQIHRWIRFAAVAVVLLAIFRPGLLQAMLPAMLVGSGVSLLAWIVYRVIALAGQTPEAPLVAVGIPTAEGGPNVHRPPAPPFRTAVPYTNAEYQGRHMDPTTPRRVPLRRKMTELTGGMASATIAVAVVTAVLSTMTNLLPSMEHAVQFGLVTLLGTWGVMAGSKLLEGHGQEHLPRRLGFLVLGAAVGAAAFWLDGALMLDLNDGGLMFPVFTSVGAHPLMNGLQPTLVGYMVFFGGLFGLRRWWFHGDSFRKRRFRLISVVLTGGLALLLSFLWAFPQTLAILWAISISSVVHLSSAWVPPAQRMVSPEFRT